MAAAHAKQAKDLEITGGTPGSQSQLVDLGEVVIIAFDRIKELNRMTDGKLYITNYRVRINLIMS
jgi:hypothetical protein